jgi:hypothetical protein
MQTITPHLVVRWLSPGGKVLMPLDGYPFSDRYGWLEERHGLSRQLMFAGGMEIKQKLTPVLMFVGMAERRRA